MTRALGIPLGCYLFVTLGLPLLGGAASNPAFGHHASVVLGLVGGLVCGGALAVRRLRRGATSP